MFERAEWEYEYALAKLAELDEAIAAIDNSPNPSRHSDTHRRLTGLAARMAGVVAQAETLGRRTPAA